MPIDKSWIHIRNRNSDEFWNGLKGFIEHAKNYTNSIGQISCPCKRCLNRKMEMPQTVFAHIHSYGFNLAYRIWVFHGETNRATQAAPIVSESADEIADILNDVASTSEAHDTHGDTQDGVGDPNDSEFTDMLSELHLELYPGCTKYSSLNFLVKLMHLKVLHKWTNESMDALLKLLKDAMPDGNKLPISHYDSKKLLSKLGLGYEIIHACPYDCTLFWKENANLQTCPICNTSRWKNTKGKKVPQKVLRYFPLKDRLKRLYASRHTAKEMTWHQGGRSKDEDLMCHPVDGKEWKEFDEKYPDFAHEPRNVRLGLSADGFNPFGNMSLSYSMWPVVTTVYNLPPWLCNKDPYKQLTLLIPGPKAPGKDIDVYLRPLVDELKELWSEGVVVCDAASNTRFKMRAMLLMTINDFPARSSLSGWSGQGYMACPTCNDETPSKRITSKICYVGHRRWLPLNHSMRNNKTFDGKIDKRLPPALKTTEQILEQLQNLEPRLPGKHEKYGGKKRKRLTTELNWSKKSIFWNLPYWASLSLRHNLDVMHIEKNVCDSLLGTILNIEGKTKDTDKARVDLQNMGVRKELHLYKQGDQWMKPRAAYTLMPDDSNKFCEFLRNVRFPDGFGSNLKKNVIVGSSSSKITGLKSHDCHVILQRLLPIGIRPFMKKEIVDTITELSNFFKLMCSRTLRVSDLKRANEEIVKILCKLETIFPPAFFDVMVHLVLHLPEEAIRGGPVYLRWMYPIERFLGSLKKYVRNRARPEGSIAEAYVVNEALTFCSMYLVGIETKFNRLERNWVENEDANIGKISVFQNRFRPIGKMTVTQLGNDLRNKAEYYILQNCLEIRDYIIAHRNEIVQYTSGESLDDIQSREFPKWFRNKMFSHRDINSPDATEQLCALASGSSASVKSYPGCVINGVKFLTHTRDINLKTQNSGISVKGPDGQTYYGILEEIYELPYTRDNFVILFKCKWFDTNPDRKKVQQYKSRISVCTKSTWYENEPFILASQAEQVFYIDDLFHGKDWKVVEHFRHRHIWDLPTNDFDEVSVVDEINGGNFELFVELPDIETMSWDQSNIAAEIVTSDLETILNDSSHVQDNFINDEEDAMDDVYIMSGHSATCAGSSGGAQPPREDPPRLPSQCESAPPARKGRGTAKGIKTQQRTSNGEKLHVEFDEQNETWKSLGVDASLYDSAVGILTRDHCEPFHYAWAEIPLHQRTQVFDTLLDYFSVDYTYRNGVLHGMVERDAMKCYRDWKSDLHDHFKKNGGLENLARARDSVPANVRDPMHWQRVCDMFISDRWQRTSLRNKGNRSKKRWNSSQGRISYTRHRSNKANTETHEPLSLIENWKDMHTREGVWVNSEAEQTYHRLQERLAQALAADPEHVDEKAIMREILGQRRGHMTGVGPTLPRKTFATTQPSATPSATYFEEQRRLMQELRGQVQTMAASHGQLLDFIATMRETFTQLHPNTPLPFFPPPPPPASGAPSSSTAHQPDRDDQAEDLGD